MFSLRRIGADPRRVDDAVVTAADAAARLGGYELKFTSNDLPVRLPKGELVRGALEAVAEIQVEAPALIVGALEARSLRSPLVAPAGDVRRHVAVAAELESDAGPGLVIVRLALEVVKSKFNPLVGLELAVSSFGQETEAIDALEELLRQVPRPARIVFPPSGSEGPIRVTWIGGTADGGEMPFDAADRLEAIAAVQGCELSVVPNVHRNPKDVLTALKNRPPDVLLHWHCDGDRCAPILKWAREQPELILHPMASWDFEGAANEMRALLSELDPLDHGVNPPSTGDTRFYIKLGGSMVGDRMIVVPDCDHNKWGDDARAKAPRAFKGIAATEGVIPVHLAKCVRCTKNRWRARF